MNKAEYVFQKLAKVGPDTRPIATDKANRKAAYQAMRGTSKVFNSKDYMKYYLKEFSWPNYIADGFTGTLLGAGVGTLAGVAHNAVWRRRMKSPLQLLVRPDYRHFWGPLGGIFGAYGGSMANTFKQMGNINKEYLKPKGIDYDASSFKGKFFPKITLSPEAKQKYLSDAYRGGGYKKS